MEQLQIHQTPAVKELRAHFRHTGSQFELDLVVTTVGNQYLRHSYRCAPDEAGQIIEDVAGTYTWY